jgi:RNA polymerase sigma-70 factor (ECF subfamily)
MQIEKSIIEECRKGDFETAETRQAFSVLIKKSSPYAFSVAFRMLGNEAQASDVVQECFIAIWKNINKIKSAESYKSWMYHIVLNKCYDELRKRKKNPEISTDQKAWDLISNRISEEPSAEMENKETAGMISVLTEKLSPKQKAVFILSELEEMTHEEICGITSMSKTSVKANLHYARKRISELIEKNI